MSGLSHPITMTKPKTWTSLLLAGLLITGFARHAQASLFSDEFDGLAVAERAKSSQREPGKPISYMAFDGGYIEAGDPITGDTPPTADQVRQSIESALASQGFQAGQTSPDLVITYHWGVLRVDHRQINVPYQIRRNLSARIALVSTEKMDAEVENHIRDREKSSGENLSFASPRFLVAPLDSVVAHARLPRIFVVISAYDFKSLSQRREANLMWRTKLSAQESSGEMARVIPPLISRGSPYFGADSDKVAIFKAVLGGEPAKALPASYKAPPTPGSCHLDQQVMDELFKRVRTQISGEDDNS